MGYITDQTYYNNTANHGSYQYVPLQEVVQNYMAVYVGDDQAVDNVPRWRVLFFAKRCIQELNYHATRSFKVLEEVIDSDLKMIMPHDYVDYVRISLYNNGQLFPLQENRKPLSATKYLVDNSNALVFDGNGYVQETTSTVDSDRLAASESVETDPCSIYNIGAKFYLDPSEANINPKFEIDRDNGIINFNSEMDGETVVLEYISDGMKGGDDTLISVHKYFEQYLYDYITYSILNAKRGIPQYEKRNAQVRMRASHRNSKIAIADFTGPKVLMTLRGKNKSIK